MHSLNKYGKNFEITLEHQDFVVYGKVKDEAERVILIDLFFNTFILLFHEKKLIYGLHIVPSKSAALLPNVYNSPHNSRLQTTVYVLSKRKLKNASFYQNLFAGNTKCKAQQITDGLRKDSRENIAYKDFHCPNVWLLLPSVPIGFTKTNGIGLRKHYKMTPEIALALNTV